ncbi:MAG: Gfo/Idh/MocA family protein [Candidatus Limnocylindria bacterium]
MKIGVVGGGGSFAREFIPLFAAHPDVAEVVLAEVVPERRREVAERFAIRRTVGSLDELLATDVDAVAIFTQRWLHAPQAIAALRAGRHVYSAVPAAISIPELTELVATVEATGRTYMMGETSHYYPAAIYCRQRYRAGDFGRVVYAEGEYLHDMSHGFYDAYRHSGGAEWKRTASFPPMLYGTHSVAMVLSVTGGAMTHVSCLGQEDDEDDGVFDAEVSQWANPFSNQTALFRMADGGSCRINEFRRIGISAGPSVRLSMFGTRASFEEQARGRVWTTRDAAAPEDLEAALRCAGYPDEDPARPRIGIDASFSVGLSPVHDAGRLPASFAGLPNGHYGSHQFLALDFIEACTLGRRPSTTVWDAARYCAPGIVAHESSQRGGTMLEIPRFPEPSGTARD